MRNPLLHYVIRMILYLFLFLIKMLNLVLSRKKRCRNGGLEILLTGTFHSRNWVESHIVPLASSEKCKILRVVSLFPVQNTNKIEHLSPPGWLINIIGGVPARLLLFMWVGIKTKPDVVGGFHFLFNGLISILLGSLIRARIMYFCVGGPAEFENGGILSENKLFEKMKSPDVVVENLLLKIVRYADQIITMGGGARTYFNNSGVTSRVEVISGGIDSKNYSFFANREPYDLIFVGRLAPIKRLDILISIIKDLSKVKPDIKAVVVGDGAIKNDIIDQAALSNIDKNIHFAGFQSNTVEWLSKSKIFLLTSDSEGLSLALMEAMLCGLPAVVSDVGDLSDLVVNGNNGYLVEKGDVKRYVQVVSELLADHDKYCRFSESARQSALFHDVNNCIQRWDRVLTDLCYFGQNRV